MTSYDLLRIISLIWGIAGICILIITLGLRIIYILRDRHNLDTKKYDLDIKRYMDDRNHTIMSPARTKEFMEFLKFLTTEIAFIQFQKYRMNNNIMKANRSGAQNLISMAASETFEALTKDPNLFNDNNLLTKDYYMQYITNIAMVTIDKLFNDAIDNVID